MAILHIPDQNYSTSDSAQIKEYFNARGILFEQWEAKAELANDADQQTILEAYGERLEPYMQANGYKARKTTDGVSEWQAAGLPIAKNT